MRGLRVLEDEAFGTYEEAWRETYGRSQRAPRVSKTADAVRTARSKPPPPAYATGRELLVHDCGARVYAESIGGGPFVQPDSCWRCLEPLDSRVMPERAYSEDAEAARELGG